MTDPLSFAYWVPSVSGTDADADTQARLLELTERYCVVARTLQDPPPLTVRLA